MSQSKKRTRKLMVVTMLTTMAIVTHMIEATIVLPIPGVHLGVANVFGILALFMYGKKEMLSVNLMRVLLSSLLNGRLLGYPFFMSLMGVLLSSLMVILFKRLSTMSMIGLNCVSATFHSVGQMIVLMVVFQTTDIIFYLGILILLAIPTGVLTGYLSKMVNERIMKGDLNHA